MLKKYQPERTDLLINADWGLPREDLTAADAKNQSMVLFHSRWVTKAEKKQLQGEFNAYRSIRIIGIILMLFPLAIVINAGAIFRSGILSVLLIVIYALIVFTAGYGLIKYRRPARMMAVLICVSFFVFPFTSLFADDKGAPFLIFTGIIGLNYLLGTTTRKIFSPPGAATTVDTKKRRALILKTIYGFIFGMAIFAGWFFYDISQAKRQAADACRLAKPGMSLEDYLAQFGQKDYIVIRRADNVMIVPKRGMGRNHCMVSHDGRNITAAKTGFTD